MGEVKLAILEPQNGQRFVGPSQTNVRMRGNVLSAGHGTLHYRWYGGASGALNTPSDNPLDLTKPLAVGSHVLTFTAKDKPGDAVEDLKAVREAGMAGGPPEEGVEAPCVVHVFVAEIVEPAAGAPLSRAGGTLTAVAPEQWGKLVDLKDPDSGYEPNGDYHEVNRIRYRWRFQPSGPPAGRASGELVPSVQQLAFDVTEDDPPVVRYQGPLPGGLGSGSYTLTLRVEDKGGPAVGHETSLAVVLT